MMSKEILPIGLTLTYMADIAVASQVMTLKSQRGMGVAFQAKGSTVRLSAPIEAPAPCFNPYGYGHIFKMPEGWIAYRQPNLLQY
jgi:hypothetical protein